MLNELKVDQALFGYSDGHHLLAASVRFNARELERLLVLSDVAPNASVAGAEGYWTGSPLPDSERYAIIRTWPATEMSRPGCVWSHVLILNSEIIDQAWDITALTKFFERPNISEGFASYQLPIASYLEMPSREASADYLSESVIDAVYLGSSNSLISLKPNQQASALLSVWSQQWPGLRNSFRFRTLPRTSSSRNPVLQFDFMSDSIGDKRKPLDDLGDLSWLNEASKDLLNVQPSRFRRYLREFGHLLPATPRSFCVLASAYTLQYEHDAHPDRLASLFKKTEDLYPSESDAQAFKRQLVTFDRSYESLLGAQNAVLTLQWFIASPGGPAWKLLSTKEENIRFLWSHARPEMLNLIQAAVSSIGEFAKDLIVAVATYSSVSELASFAQKPEVYAALAARNSNLLSTNVLNTLPEESLLGLIEAVENELPLVRTLCEALSANPSPRVAEAIFKFHPIEAVRRTAALLSRAFHQEPTNPFWLQLASMIAPATLDRGIVETFETTSELAAFAEILNFLTGEVVSSGPLPWARAIDRASDSVEGAPRQTFQAFLVALALKVPTPGSGRLFRFGFESLHRMLWDSSLNHQASVILESALPESRWFWQNWDVCLRLRRGIVRAFVDGGLPTGDFLSLTQDPSLLGMLLEALDDGRADDRSFREDIIRSAIDSASVRI